MLYDVQRTLYMMYRYGIPGMVCSGTDAPDTRSTATHTLARVHCWHTRNMWAIKIPVDTGKVLLSKKSKNYLSSPLLFGQQ